jgi:hypothetical protein
VTSYTKSGKKVESNFIFDIRVRTAPDGTPYILNLRAESSDKYVEVPYARLRGLYFMPSPSIGNPSAALVAVSPRITLSFILNGTTQYTAVSENVYARTTDVLNPNYVLHDKFPRTKSADVLFIRIRELQELARNGFGYVGLVTAYYFGVPADPTDPNSTSEFESNNQTSYEMELPMSTARLPERIGQRVDIAPHPALASSISEKAYMVDIDVDWTARDAKSDYVKAKFLTRNIKFD